VIHKNLNTVKLIALSLWLSLYSSSSWLLEPLDPYIWGSEGLQNCDLVLLSNTNSNTTLQITSITITISISTINIILVFILILLINNLNNLLFSIYY